MTAPRPPEEGTTQESAIDLSDPDAVKRCQQYWLEQYQNYLDGFQKNENPVSANQPHIRDEIGHTEMSFAVKPEPQTTVKPYMTTEDDCVSMLSFSSSKSEPQSDRTLAEQLSPTLHATDREKSILTPRTDSLRIVVTRAGDEPTGPRLPEAQICGPVYSAPADAAKTPKVYEHGRNEDHATTTPRSISTSCASGNSTLLSPNKSPRCQTITEATSFATCVVPKVQRVRTHHSGGQASPSSLTLAQVYNRAFSKATEAKRADAAGEDPSETFKLYVDAARCFANARSREKDQKRQKLIFDNANELLTRAESIRSETNAKLAEALEAQSEMYREIGDDSTADQLDSLIQSVENFRFPVFRLRDLSSVEKIPLSVAFVLLEVLGEGSKEAEDSLDLTDELSGSGPGTPSSASSLQPSVSSHNQVAHSGNSSISSLSPSHSQFQVPSHHSGDTSNLHLGLTPTSDPCASSPLNPYPHLSVSPTPLHAPTSSRSSAGDSSLGLSITSPTGSTDSSLHSLMIPNGNRLAGSDDEGEASDDSTKSLRDVPPPPYTPDVASPAGTTPTTEPSNAALSPTGGSSVSRQQPSPSNGSGEAGAQKKADEDAIFRIPVSSLQSFQSDISQRDDEIGELQETVANLEMQLEALRHSNASAPSSPDEHSAAPSQPKVPSHPYGSQNVHLQQQHAGVSAAALKESEKARAEAEAAKDAAEVSRMQAVAELEETKEKLSTLRAELAIAEDESTSRQEKIDDLRLELILAKEEKNGLQNMLDEQEKTLKQLESLHEMQSEELAASLRRMEEFSKFAGDQLEDEKKAHAELKIKSTKLNDRIGTLELELEKCKEEKQTAESRISELEGEHKTKTDEHRERFASVEGERDKAHNELSNLKGKIEDGDFPLSDKSECTVCMENAKTVALRPCGHLCVCEECLLSLGKGKERKCPICRSPVKGHLRIFF